jgi:hypothetical protein
MTLRDRRSHPSFTAAEYERLEKAATEGHTTVADLCRVAALEYVAEPPLTATERTWIRRLLRQQPAEVDWASFREVPTTSTDQELT